MVVVNSVIEPIPLVSPNPSHPQCNPHVANKVALPPPAQATNGNRSDPSTQSSNLSRFGHSWHATSSERINVLTINQSARNGRYNPAEAITAFAEDVCSKYHKDNQVLLILPWNEDDHSAQQQPCDILKISLNWSTSTITITPSTQKRAESTLK